MGPIEDCRWFQLQRFLRAAASGVGGGNYSCSLAKKMDATTAFDRRLKHVPDAWSRPLIEVIDTFENVQIGLKSIGIEDSFVLIEATRMVIERHDKERAELAGQLKPVDP
jgi:hypothetical protein